MNIKRHGIALLVALIFFGVITLVSGTGSAAALYAVGAILLAASGCYFHYHRLARPQRDLVPSPQGSLYVLPGKDPMRMPPKVMQIAVTVRDKGKCRIRNPATCTTAGEVIDHIIPWAKGGSSRDMRNLQLACNGCNRWKSDKILV